MKNPKTNLKTTQKLLSLVSGKSQSIYRQNWAPGHLYGAVRQILACDSTREPRKRGYGRISAVIRWPCAWRRLLRNPLMSPCRLDVQIFGLEPLVLTKSLSKINGCFCRSFNHQLNGNFGSSSSFHAMDLETCKRGIISRI